MTSADRCRWSLIALAAIAGCFDPTYNNARCDPSGACPSGFHCEGTTCVAGGGDDDDTPPEPSPDPDPGSGAPSAQTAIAMFASCMSVSLAEFNATKAYQIATMNTQEQSRCFSCHIGLDNLATWLDEAYFVGLFTAVLQPDLTYEVVAAETKICNKGNESQNMLGFHPAYDCRQNNSAALDALKVFAVMVQAKVERRDPSCPPLAMFTPPASPPR